MDVLANQLQLCLPTLLFTTKTFEFSCVNCLKKLKHSDFWPGTDHITSVLFLVRSKNTVGLFSPGEAPWQLVKEIQALCNYTTLIQSLEQWSGSTGRERPFPSQSENWTGSPEHKVHGFMSGFLLLLPRGTIPSTSRNSTDSICQFPCKIHDVLFNWDPDCNIMHVQHSSYA